MLIPLGKRIILKPIEAKKSILCLANVQPIHFEVISIGDEVTKVKPGNIIYLADHYGVHIEFDNEKFLIIDESSILAKIG